MAQGAGGRDRTLGRVGGEGSSSAFTWKVWPEAEGGARGRGQESGSQIDRHGPMDLGFPFYPSGRRVLSSASCRHSLDTAGTKVKSLSSQAVCGRWGQKINGDEM